MIDLQLLRENPTLYSNACANKRFPDVVQEALALDRELRPIKQELEAQQQQRNLLSKEIPQCKSPEERAEKIAKVADIKTSMQVLTEKQRALTELLDSKLLQIPQPPSDQTPIGKSDSENVEIRTWGEKKTFDFPFKDHVTLCEDLGLLETDRATKLSGARSYILRGAGARLEQAVMRLTFDFLNNRGYEPLSVPLMVKEPSMVGTGYFPIGRDQAYNIEKDELFLIGTGEIVLTALYMNEILKTSDLPKRMFTQSACFRREAGTYGKDTRGLYRVHQFQKIEQVILSTGDTTHEDLYHDELLKNAEDLMQLLELPYRVVSVCTGDLGLGQRKKHDIEAWMPSREGYGETHSCSSFRDFQARRLGIRYRDSQDQKPSHVFTYNNTAIASPRILIPLLEIHQQKDGRIKIPKALQSYYGAEFL